MQGDRVPASNTWPSVAVPVTKLQRGWSAVPRGADGVTSSGLPCAVLGS